MIERLASSLGRNDESPNIDLDVELAGAGNSKGIQEIVDGLSLKEAIANDCIKVLYEVGQRNPSLIAPHVKVFLMFLKSRNNRMVWGAMTALSYVTPQRPKEVSDDIETVVYAYEHGSVITVDNAISVFAALAQAGGEYEKIALPLIFKHLENCRPKEVGQHAERALPGIPPHRVAEFKTILKARLDSLTDAQKKRVAKLIK